MGVEITNSAIKRIARILASEPEKIALRISIEGGGCSGFSYKYDLVSEPPADDDLVIKKDGATIVIDSVSLPFMDGSEIDFVDDLMGQAFKIHNPNAVSSCGCGASFSI